MPSDFLPPISPSRRQVLGTLVGVGGLAAAGMLPGLSGVGSAPLSDHTNLLDLAATTEALTVTFYHAVLSGAEFVINDEAADQLRLMLDAERQHLELLRALGGTPQTGPFYLPVHLLADASVFVHSGQQLERVATGMYIAATHEFAALGQPTLAATAAQLAASEAQHQMLLSHLAGLGGVATSLPSSDFGRPVEVGPALASFLRRTHASATPATLPTAGQLSAALNGRTSVPGRPFRPEAGGTPSSHTD